MKEFKGFTKVVWMNKGLSLNIDFSIGMTSRLLSSVLNAAFLFLSKEELTKVIVLMLTLFAKKTTNKL